MKISYIFLFMIIMPIFIYTHAITLNENRASRFVRKVACTQENCSDFCESNLSASEKTTNSKYLIARCQSSGTCQCLYPWRRSIDSMMTWTPL